MKFGVGRHVVIILHMENGMHSPLSILIFHGIHTHTHQTIGIAQLLPKLSCGLRVSVCFWLIRCGGGEW